MQIMQPWRNILPIASYEQLTMHWLGLHLFHPQVTSEVDQVHHLEWTPIYHTTETQDSHLD
jgi:hypothetical protein